MIDSYAIVCVLWKGDFRGRVYDEDWVIRLHQMVRRKTTVPFRFYCLTNSNCKDYLTRHGVTTMPLFWQWPGWWSKMEVFSPWVRWLTSRVLYLDLDVLITKDLAPIFEYNSPFAIKGKFNRTKATESSDRRGVVTRYNSSIMVFNTSCEAVASLWNGFHPKTHRDIFRGDQDYIGWRCPSLDLLPDEWVTKLRYLLARRPDNHARVILSMPHKNNEAAKRYAWVRELWGNPIKEGAAQ